jgi:phosphatidate cytidylyltransferase
MIALVLSLMAFMMAYVFTYPKYKTDQIAVAFFGIVYVAVMLSYIYSVRMTTYGVFTVWLIFLASWGSDTCAYAFGVMFGKHKMAPVLSPKKSVEGAVGGVLGSALLGFIYACAVGGKMTDIIDARIMFPIVCFFGALISMVGDLAASAIKRHNDIKDYGTLIPGHGGILDRFDSVIFTSPLIWLLVVLMSRI